MLSAAGSEKGDGVKQDGVDHPSNLGGFLLSSDFGRLGCNPRMGRCVLLLHVRVQPSCFDQFDSMQGLEMQSPLRRLRQSDKGWSELLNVLACIVDQSDCTLLAH